MILCDSVGGKNNLLKHSWYNTDFLRLRKTQNALQLPTFFFFVFFCQPYPGLQNCKSVLLILKILNNWCKNWYIHFYKTYDHQVRQAGTSTEFDSNETNQAGAGDVIRSRSCEKLKTLYLHYQSACSHITGQDGNLPWWAPAQ